MTSPRKLFIGLCFVGLAGCKSGGIETSQDAANVYLSTYPAVAWKEVADKLEPRLDLAPEVSKAFTVDGYNAHLVTLQVALQPKARNLPYDVYLNISMYPATSWKEAVASPRAKLARGGPPLVMVYPLTISESVEGVGIDALASVGRVSDNAIRIRFGAQEYGMVKDKARYGILPRTHNVQMVVITRALLPVNAFRWVKADAKDNRASAGASGKEKDGRNVCSMNARSIAGAPPFHSG